jgi:hypothetical protein
MADEYEEAQAGEEMGNTGPGAPTPISALEVSKQTTICTCKTSKANAHYCTRGSQASRNATFS